MIDRELEAEVLARTRALCRAFGIREPTIAFDLSGATAGLALWPENRIRLNPVLLRENRRAFLDEVVPHELCHLWHRQLGKRDRPHGRVWQGLMRRMGVEPKRCHDFDLANARVRRLRRFVYACPCGTHELTSRRHRKVLRGEATYACRRCGERLTPQGRRGASGPRRAGSPPSPGDGSHPRAAE